MNDFAVRDGVVILLTLVNKIKYSFPKIYRFFKVGCTLRVWEEYMNDFSFDPKIPYYGNMLLSWERVYEKDNKD